MDRGRYRSSYLGDEGNSVSLDCLQSLDHGGILSLDERQCHGGGIHKLEGSVS